jgi:anti-sigma factor RsiW
MIDCKRFIECLSDYIDDELEETIRIEFEDHLASCENARALVRTFERTIIMHREIRCGRVPGDVKRRLRAVLKQCMERSE